MALSRTERFKFKSRILEEIVENGHEWTLQRQNVLLTEFGLETIDGGWDGPSFDYIIRDISDADLVEMYSIVTGISVEEVEDIVESNADPGNWKPGYVRLFLSHSAKHKKFAGELADELVIVGIHGFVAHDTMAYSKPWQEQIERGLRSMQAFVAIIHEEFNGSAWCHQEVGWALGRRIPRYVVRVGVDPAGFIGREQWPSGHDLSAKEIASIISRWVNAIPELGETLIGGLFTALESAGNYMDAGAAAERIASLDSLTTEQFDRLDAIWHENDQLYTGYLPSQALAPFYKRSGRPWPPPDPAKEVVATTDPWAAASPSDEPPF